MGAMMQKRLVEGSQPRTFFDFVGDVNELLKSRTGVSYGEVAKSFHPGMDAPKHALENGVEPSDFVDGMIEDERLVEIGDEFSREEAHSYNMAQSAIAEFVFEARHSGWHRTVDGIPFANVEDSVLTMRPVRNNLDNSYGFGIEIRAGATMDEWHTTFEDMGTVEARFAGSDIGQALEQAREHVNTMGIYAF